MENTIDAAPCRHLDGARLRAEYGAAPFGSIVLPGFWNPEYLGSIAAEVAVFQDFDGEKDFYGSRRKRHCGTYEKLPVSVQRFIDFCHSAPFIEFLEQMTGERDLQADPYLEGGGIHSIGRDGFLKIHADFNWHSQLQLYRRINLLVYLNRNWKAEWGGTLELWTRDMAQCFRAVPPEFNTSVIFTTDDSSYHGHPDPLKCPQDVRRNSIALYYYSPHKPQAGFAEERLTTSYVGRSITDLNKTGDLIRRKLKGVLGRLALEPVLR